MGRSKVEINPIRGKRLQTIIKESGESNISFAKRFGYSAEHISQIIIGKRRLTDAFVERIIAEYPKYRIEWLLGIDDYKTESERLLLPLAMEAVEHDTLFLSLSALSQLNDFTILRPRIPPNDASVEEIHSSIVNGFTVTKGGKSISLSFKEMDALEKLIADFVRLQLDFLFKQKGAWNHGKH